MEHDVADLSQTSMHTHESLVRQYQFNSSRFVLRSYVSARLNKIN